MIKISFPIGSSLTSSSYNIIAYTLQFEPAAGALLFFSTLFVGSRLPYTHTELYHAT